MSIGRACVICGQISDQSRCPSHRERPWAGDRRSKTISGWAQQKRARQVLGFHRGICHVCGKPGADEVDHVIALSAGGSDRFENLRPVHSVPCHTEKTQRESLAGRS